jgi:hypothetical protein
MVTAGKPLPFRVLDGPTREVFWTDALIAFLTFYHRVVFKKTPPHEAVAVMNHAAGLPESFFVAVDGAKLRRRVAASTRDRKLRSLRALLEEG